MNDFMILEFTPISAIIHGILFVGFLIASITLGRAAYFGLPAVRWIRALGTILAGLLSAWYFGIFLNSSGLYPTDIGLMAVLARGLNTLVLSLLLIWGFLRPDRKGKY